MASRASMVLAARGQSQSAPSTGTVLVIDDDEPSRAFARSVLEEEGYDIRTAGSGAEGLAIFEASRPDCVLLDMRMRGMDGVATCRHLRALPGGHDVPILFMTAQGSVDAFDRAQQCGGDDFVTKPVSPSELLERLQSALALRQARSRTRDLALLKAQRDRLLRAQLQRERLSALLVHDLKAPLNTIALLAQGVLRGGSLAPEGRAAVEEIRLYTRRLSSMIMNLLDISKSQNEGLSVHCEPVDALELCQGVLRDFELAAQERQVSLRTAIVLDTVDADPTILRRLLTNLVDNALRYAPNGSTVTLSASPRPAFSELRVVDQGSGIAPALRERVFDAFAQSEAGVSEGRGLGLAFCKLAAEAHGGRIWIEDASPGTAICVSLPWGCGRHSKLRSIASQDGIASRSLNQQSINAGVVDT